MDKMNKRRKKYRKSDGNIANLVANYESENVMQFLYGIANLFISELVNSYHYCNVYLYFFIQ